MLIVSQWFYNIWKTSQNLLGCANINMFKNKLRLIVNRNYIFTIQYINLENKL